MKILKCGHTPNAKKEGKPCCVICNCSEFSNSTPNLIGRKSLCFQCGKIETSSLNLAFFEYRPKQDFDKHYCGCYGWD